MGLFDSIGALFGGAPNNADFTAQSAPLIAATNTQQINGAYGTANDALAQQQALLQALQAQNGIGNQNQVYGQLQGVINGTGPNPAQALLNESTGQNVANQAALMAGQRGAGSNVGLIARQAGQQGAALQQQAAGQGAALQAQQGLSAISQAGGLAGQQAANQIGSVGSYNQLAQNEQQQLLQALSNQNNSNVANTGNMNSNNQAMAAVNANNTAKSVGGLLNGAGIATGLLPKPGAALGGMVSSKEVTPPKGENPKIAQVPGKDQFPSHLKEIHMMYHGGSWEAAPQSMKSGGKVPGEAKVSGDSPKNDTVDAKLSPGEVVIPKSIMESDDPAARAAKFVADLMKKGAKSPEGDFKDALRKAIAGRKSK